MNDDITLNLNIRISQTNIVLAALEQGQFATVAPIIAAIREQAEAQIAKHNAFNDVFDHPIDDDDAVAEKATAVEMEMAEVEATSLKKAR